MNRRSFLTTAGATATCSAASVSLLALSPTDHPSTNRSAPNKAPQLNGLPSTAWFDSLLSSTVQMVKELQSPSLRSLVDIGELHTNVKSLFEMFAASGVNEKLDAYIKEKGGAAKVLRKTKAPYSTADMTVAIDRLKELGVPLSKKEVHAINVSLNTPPQSDSIATVLDKYGMTRTQQAIAMGLHPKAEERYALYQQYQEQYRPSAAEPKMFVAAEAYQYPIWDPTNWWWWQNWQVWDEITHPEHYPEEQVQVDDGSYQGPLFTWPAPDDPTNYTIYSTEDIEAAMNSFLSTGAVDLSKDGKFCRMYASVIGASANAVIAILRADPEFMAELAIVLPWLTSSGLILLGLALAVAFLYMAYLWCPA
jgi:hypothetical protein